MFFVALGILFFAGQNIPARAAEAETQTAETELQPADGQVPEEIETQAADGQAREMVEDAGGTRAEAMEIELNQTYSEVLSSGSDEDYFKFTTTERGYFQVDLKHNDSDDNEVENGWDVNVLDENGHVITFVTGICKNWTSVIIPYALPGRTFYVQVFADNQYWCPFNCLYDLKVNQTASEDWELELNETIADANEIKTDKEYHGITLVGSDEDYFKFTTTVRGYFQIDFDQDSADTHDVQNGWNVKVLDENGNVITSTAGIKSWTSVIIPYAQPGKTFYVRVLANNQYWCPFNCVYNLTVNQTASEDWELESNGTVTNANEIKTDKVYHGITLFGSDVDYFKFTTTVWGYFQVSFMQNLSDIHDVQNGWDVNVLDENGNIITSGTGIGKNWTSIIIPYAQPGKTFYVQVFADNQYWCPFNCLYDLKVTQKADTFWESEPNGTMAAATPIGMNQTYHGITGSSGDTDLFRFTTTALGYFNVQLSHNHIYSSNESPRWDVRVLDSAGELLIRYNDVRTAMTTVPLPYAQAGRTFYIQVERYNGSAWGAYDLSVVQTAASDWEQEPNGTLAGATSIQVGKTYQGITLSSSEKDYYKTNVSSAGRLEIRLSPLASNAPGSVESGWDIFVYDHKYNEVARLRGVKTDDSFGLDVKKGTYYIRIEPYSSWSAPEFCRYSVSTTFAKAPSKPKIASVKAAKRAAIVKWKKVSGASGYYIYRSESKKGEYVKVKTIKKGSAVSWKNKKLYSGKKYYYKVAAYKKTKGMVAVSSYSKVKSVKVK